MTILHAEDEWLFGRTASHDGWLPARATGSVLIVGAGFIGVEWATEIKFFFPNIEITICDMLPKCLGPLPDRAKDYCQRYMDANGIKSVYKAKFNPNQPDYKALGLAKN